MKQELKSHVRSLASLGRSNQEISDILGISLSRVKYHKKPISKTKNHILYDEILDYLSEIRKPVDWTALHDKFKNRAKELKIKFSYRFMRQFITQYDHCREQIIFKRRTFTIKQKLDLLDQCDLSSVEKVAHESGVAENTLNEWNRNAHSLRTFSLDNNPSYKLLPNLQYGNIDEYASSLIKRDRQSNRVVRMMNLAEASREYGQNCGQDFKGSNGWVSSFQRRHQTKNYKVYGDGLDVDWMDVESWFMDNEDVIKSYPPEDIFNIDETGLYYKDSGSITLDTSSTNCRGTKSSKDRLTIVLCCSMKGEKYPPLVIGKSLKPRCFARQIPDFYRGNPSAWNNATIFQEWLTDFGRSLGERNILLLLDSVAFHHLVHPPANVKLLFLPKNCTSVCQPLDQGIIWSFKSIYRRKKMKKLVMPDVKVAYDLVQESFAEVSQETIENCFKDSAIWSLASIEEKKLKFKK